MRKKIPISQFDRKAYKIIRKNVRRFLSREARRYDGRGKLILDIAPQIHEGAAFYFRQGKVETLDIDPCSGATYIADLTQNNSALIKAETFDIIVCTEVLEHTLNPFLAVKEMFRILKKDGVLLVSVPFNFRIHGPQPDCWRFTEQGLKALFQGFQRVRIKQINTPGRSLTPIHYTLTLRK